MSLIISRFFQIGRKIMSLPKYQQVWEMFKSSILWKKRGPLLKKKRYRDNAIVTDESKTEIFVLECLLLGKTGIFRCFFIFSQASYDFSITGFFTVSPDFLGVPGTS